MNVTKQNTIRRHDIRVPTSTDDSGLFHSSVHHTWSILDSQPRELPFSESVGVLGHCSQIMERDMSCTSVFQNSSFNISKILGRDETFRGLSVAYEQAWTFMTAAYIVASISTWVSLLVYFVKLKPGWNRSLNNIILIVSCYHPLWSYSLTHLKDGRDRDKHCFDHINHCCLRFKK